MVSKAKSGNLSMDEVPEKELGKTKIGKILTWIHRLITVAISAYLTGTKGWL